MENSSVIQVLPGSCVAQPLFTRSVTEMGEISINHALLEECRQTGKSRSVVPALLVQLLLTDIFSFHSACKYPAKIVLDISTAKMLDANLVLTQFSPVPWLRSKWAPR